MGLRQPSLASDRARRSLAWAAAVAIAAPVLACIAPQDACGQPSTAPGVAAAAPPVRLVMDLECPHSRKAWPLYRDAVQSHGIDLLIHHLPVSRHPQARNSALAALAARAQGRELAYIDALLQGPGLDDAALGAAAVKSALDPERFAKDRADPRLSEALDRERHAALAFGVQATPSALIAGRGLGGVPTPEGLHRQLIQARYRLDRVARPLPAGADAERAAMALAQPEFLEAFDNLRQARFGESLAARRSGMLGTLYRVDVAPDEQCLGPAQAAITAVVYVDPAQAWTVRQLGQLRRWQAQTAASRLVVRVLPAPQSVSQRLALMWTALALNSTSRCTTALAALPERAAWSQDDLLAAAAALGPGADRQFQRLDRPELTAALHGVVAAARHIDASAGAVFVNGHRWLGSVTDSEWVKAAESTRAPWATDQAYRQRIRDGRWRQEAELDLREPLALGDLSRLATVGTGSTEILVLMDFSSPASRAAWHMLRRWIAPGPLASRLFVAALPERRAAQQDLNQALLAASALARTAAAVTALFDLPSAEPKTPGGSQAAWLAKALGVAPDQWRSALQAAAVADVRDRLRWVQRQTDWGEEPVIFLAGRLYTGPLDEARLERALRFAVSTAQAERPPVRVAQEAP